MGSPEVGANLIWSSSSLSSLSGFMQYYRENAKYKERTYTFVERIGIERIRALVVQDSEGIVRLHLREFAHADRCRGPGARCR